ncbi:protein SRG1-like [Oryza brachyantha]|uniref:protein SRG1-like n=1 Tax=Oryza brachyantha TaxID=4533 RepID=UPI001ADB5CF0|nr:protein SRG1-like [Oryza brachyantha]
MGYHSTGASGGGGVGVGGGEELRRWPTGRAKAMKLRRFVLAARGIRRRHGRCRRMRWSPEEPRGVRLRRQRRRRAIDSISQPPAGMSRDRKKKQLPRSRQSRNHLSKRNSEHPELQTTMADGHQWKIVKIPPIVQELAGEVHEPPSQYVVREQDRPSVAAVSGMPEPVPIVDLSRLSASDDEDRAGELARLRSAVEDWGLFLAVGHGIDPSFLGEVINVTRGFYELPLEEKQKYSNLVNGKEFRIEGYGDDMVVSEEQILDWCDRFYLIVEPESRIAHSLWPTQPPSFRDVVREHTVRCREIAGLVLAKMAGLLGLQEGYFAGMLDENAMTYARFNYYPRCPRPEQVLGLKPHSDASVITVASMDDSVSGLQVLRQGVWYDVPIVPNALLINVGDGIEIMSNGAFKSPVHRVVTNAERDRVSLAMFYTLDPEKELEPAPELVDDERRPRRYAKTKTKDYVTGLFETFARGTRVIDTVRISE